MKEKLLHCNLNFIRKNWHVKSNENKIHPVFVLKLDMDLLFVLLLLKIVCHTNKWSLIITWGELIIISIFRYKSRCLEGFSVTKIYDQFCCGPQY